MVQQPNAFRLLLSLVAVVALVRRRWRTAGWLASLVALSIVAAPFAKLAVRRERPVWVDPVRVLSDYSYPSGHASAAWAAVAALVVLALTELRRGRRRLVLVVVLVAAATVVSADRVFLGVHYPSDVLGGALLGVALALGTWLIWRPRGPGTTREPAPARVRSQVGGRRTDPR